MSHMIPRAACWFLLSASLLGCSQNGGPESRAAQRLTPEQVAQIERERPILELVADEFAARVVASVGDCAPEVANPYVLTACCDGYACNGQCVSDDGSVACSCFDTEGGCPDGQVCCQFRRACTAPEDCEPP